MLKIPKGKSNAVRVGVSEMIQTIRESSKEVKRKALWVYYPLFLLYSLSIIGLLKLAQVIL